MKEIEKPMYYGAKPETFEVAKILTKNMTLHEKLLWGKLKLKKICGAKIRCQHPIDFFIADFYCHAARLVIEVDGNQHNQQKDYDIGRSAEMARYFIKVIRFSNSEVENNMEGVVTMIENEVAGRIQSPPWGI